MPDLYAIDGDSSTGLFLSPVYRGFTADGRVTRVDTPPFSGDEHVDKTMGDPWGGLVVVARRDIGAWDLAHVVLARFGGPPGLLPWRYDGGGVSPYLDDSPQVAQANDGTIFLLEWSEDEEWVVVLDGDTGVPLRRIATGALGSWSWARLHPGCPWNDSSGESGPLIGPLSVGADGTVYAEVLSESDTITYEGCNGADTRVFTYTVQLLSITPAGAWTLTPLHEATDPSFVYLEAQQVLPASDGGALAVWTEIDTQVTSMAVYVHGGTVNVYQDRANRRFRQHSGPAPTRLR